jgi:multiple sugar transport system substrate-binding protein
LAGLVLASCAQTTPAPAVVHTQVVEVPVTVAPTAQTGPVPNTEVVGNVELWHFWSSPIRRNAIKRVIALCQQQLPGIAVLDTVLPFGQLWADSAAAVKAGLGMPDVIVSDRPNLRRDAVAGIYEDLQAWADRDGVARDQFYDWAWDQTELDGNTYGIPFETDVTVLFYNKTLFAQAGLDPERPPVTWDEVEAFADRLDRRGPDGELERIGFFPLWNRGAGTWQYAGGGEMIAPDGSPRINNPRMVAAAEWIKSWVDRYGGWEAVQAFDAAYNQAPPADNFMSGRIAMRVDIFGYNSSLEFYRPSTVLDNGDTVRTEWGIALLPHAADAQSGTWSGGFAMSIPTGSPNAAAAWEFIKCATGADGQASWARDTQAQPTNIAAATDPVVLAMPQWPIAVEALSTSTGGNQLDAYPEWARHVEERWPLVWSGQLTAQAALNAAQAEVEAALR